MPDRLWIVIPAFQEERAIGQTLRALAGTGASVVVTDDGSSDATGTIAAALGARVVRHAINLGQGAALQSGIDFALAQGATHICTFDADGQHDPASIDAMMRVLRSSGADVALGSRFLGRTIGMSDFKRALLSVALAFTKLQTRLPLTDTHNGLRLFTRAAASKIALRQHGMAHASEILSLVARANMKMIEVPTTVRYTTYSRAKGQPWSNSFKILVDMCYAALTH